MPDLGLLYVLFAASCWSAPRNAVNLTDGLDGLAIGSTLIAAAAFTVLAYVTGHRRLLRVPGHALPAGAGELTVFCGAMVGRLDGLPVVELLPGPGLHGRRGLPRAGRGARHGGILIKQELLLFLVGGLFVIEALSVILQVASFKLRGKRIFRMAPLHHHFELDRLEGAADHRPLLDRGVHVRALRAHHAEAAMSVHGRA